MSQLFHFKINIIIPRAMHHSITDCSFLQSLLCSLCVYAAFPALKDMRGIYHHWYSKFERRNDWDSAEVSHTHVSAWEFRRVGGGGPGREPVGSQAE